MKKFKADVVHLDPKSLTPYPQNEKVHPREQIEKLAGILRRYGFDQPVVVDGNHVILKGHGRTEAAILAGMDSIPVIVRTDLSPSEANAARLADNKLAESSDWSADALSIVLPALKDEGFDLADLGFTSKEFDDLMAMTVPGSLEEIDNAAAEKPALPDETADWPKIHMKVPPDTHHVFLDLLARCPGQKPHEKFDALLGAVEVLALEELARIERGQ